MNGAQIYAFFVSPFVVLGFAAFIYWFTGWQDRREDSRAAAQPASSSIPKPDSPT